MKEKKYYSKKEVEEILDRASEALANLSIPKLVKVSDRPAFNGRNAYYGWKEYLLTGDINNDFAQKAREQYIQKEMIKHIILSSNGKDFTIILHACPGNTDGKFQWYIIDEPNSDNPTKIDGQTYESICFLSNQINDEYKNKWLYCKCILPDYEYNEGCVKLTDDFIEMIKINHFDSIAFFDKNGMIDKNIGYIKE